jgi:hypothetical protein
MGKITKIKKTRQLIRKERGTIALSVVKEIYDQSLRDRLMIAINIIFKRG